MDKMKATGAYDTVKPTPSKSWMIHVHMFWNISNIDCQCQFYSP